MFPIRTLQRFLLYAVGGTVVLFGVVGTGASLNAQELHEELQGVWRAEVVEVLSSGEHRVLGTELYSDHQEISVRILEGEHEGEIVQFVNDYIQLEAGDRFFLNYLVDLNGSVSYSVREPDRRVPLVVLAAFFVLAVIVLGKWQGVRALLALAINFSIILFLLLPQLLSGGSPVLLSVFYAVVMLSLSMHITHGFNRITGIALLSTLIVIVVTGIVASLSVSAAALSGFVSDESFYLNLSTDGTLDLSGLLLGAIIIGILGLLDDVAITQVTAVSEFLAVPGISRKEIFTRSLTIGREHVGALVNTLALAYAGAALPLLLLFSLSNSSWWFLINGEIIAAEIIRTLVGSIGLVLTVPLSTYFAVWFLKPTTNGKGV